MVHEGNSSSRLPLADFRPGPRGLLQLLAIVGAILLATRAMHAFPLLNQDPPVSFVVAGITFLGAFVALARFRRNVAPWGSRAPLLMWGGLAAFAALAGFLMWALVSVGNGVLDRTPPNEVRYTILGKGRYTGGIFLRVTPVADSGVGESRGYSLDVSQADWEASVRGSSVLVDLRPGFFRFPWIAGYQLCGTADSSC